MEQTSTSATRRATVARSSAMMARLADVPAQNPTRNYRDVGIHVGSRAPFGNADYYE